MWIKTEKGLINLDLVNYIYVSPRSDEWIVFVGFGGDGYYSIFRYSTEQEARSKLNDIEKLMRISGLQKVVEV